MPGLSAIIISCKACFEDLENYLDDAACGNSNKKYDLIQASHPAYTYFTGPQEKAYQINCHGRFFLFLDEYKP